MKWVMWCSLIDYRPIMWVSLAVIVLIWANAKRVVRLRIVRARTCWTTWADQLAVRPTYFDLWWWKS